jgi:hypothetical protein
MHGSHRSRLRRVPDIPLALVTRESFAHLNKDHRRRDRSRHLKIDPADDDRTTILQ